MALPVLPVAGQSPWFTERNNWDLAVKAIVENIDATVAASVSSVALTERVDPTGGPNLILGSSLNRTSLSINAAINDTSATSVIVNPGGRGGQNNVIGGDGANVGTGTPNTITSGIVANVSFIGGYDNSAGSLSSKIISDHSKTEVSGTGLGHNAIFGGATNVIRGTAQFAGIFSGYQSEVSASYSVAMGYNVKVHGASSRGGGRDNTLTGGAATIDGISNTASGLGSRTSGTSNTGTADFANIDGTLNEVSGVHGSAQGSRNKVLGSFSGARGQYANARDAYQQAFAANPWTGDLVAGKAQTSDFVVRIETTTNALTGVGIAGGQDGPTIPEGHSFFVEARITGRDGATGDTAGFFARFMCRRPVGGGVTVITPSITTVGADAGASTWALTSVTQNAGKLRINVTGENGKTIRWVGRITTVEVGSA